MTITNLRFSSSSWHPRRALLWVALGVGLLCGCVATGDKTASPSGAGSTLHPSDTNTPAPVPYANVAADVATVTQLQAQLDAALTKIGELETQQAGLVNLRFGDIDIPTAGSGMAGALLAYVLMRVTGFRPRSREQRKAEKSSKSMPAFNCPECGQHHGGGRT